MINRKYDIWDKYFSDQIYDWDIWEDWSREWITECLNDVEEQDITEEEIDFCFNEALEYQRERRQQYKEDNIDFLKSDIEYAIEQSEYSDHLDCDDIGKVLCSLASSYFES